ncbi:hypothetical protein BDK51DRAFT_52475 [Blyttiomyces helicus]|uniref:Uncharacterized protein n=1 Tax=Blyttiomyces helicus TaxID=388810 RepID=A0A4P9W508_9FUNG|nr:hypothetical protein BDK51DRAFT_52475 [Blyttiomyces helicus]|eukprot:RKO85196.1 hypothetical protein BDK51DRAFT_52475 [Blyttiomyces helicus]
MFAASPPSPFPTQDVQRRERERERERDRLREEDEGKSIKRLVKSNAGLPAAPNPPTSPTLSDAINFPRPPATGAATTKKIYKTTADLSQSRLSLRRDRDLATRRPARSSVRVLDLDLDREVRLSLDLDLNLFFDLSFPLDRTPSRELDRVLGLSLDLDLDLDLLLSLDRDLNRDLLLSLDRDLNRDLDLDLGLDDDLDRDLDRDHEGDARLLLRLAAACILISRNAAARGREGGSACRALSFRRSAGVIFFAGGFEVAGAGAERFAEAEAESVAEEDLCEVLVE